LNTECLSRDWVEMEVVRGAFLLTMKITYRFNGPRQAVCVYPPS